MREREEREKRVREEREKRVREIREKESEGGGGNLLIIYLFKKRNWKIHLQNQG